MYVLMLIENCMGILLVTSSCGCNHIYYYRTAYKYDLARTHTHKLTHGHPYTYRYLFVDNIWAIHKL